MTNTAHLTITPAGRALLIPTGATRAVASHRNCPDPAAWAAATAERLGYELVERQKPGRKPAKCRECGK